MNAKLLSIETPSSGVGNVGYTGLGFDPRSGVSLLILLGNAASASGFNTHGVIPVGMAVSSSMRWAGSVVYRDGRAVTENAHCGRSHSNALCVSRQNPTSTSPNSEADFVSWDEDGFTLNWSTSSAARYVSALVLNATEEGAAFAVGSATTPSSTGTQDITVGFNPDIFGMVHFASTTAMPAGINNVDTAFSFGAATADTMQVSGNSGLANPADDISTMAGRQLTTKLFTFPLAGGSPTAEGELVSLSSVADSVRITWDATPGSGRYWFWWAMKGVAVEIGAANQPTSTGVQTLSLGITPKAVLFASSGAAASSSNTDHVRQALGVTDGATEACYWSGSRNGLDTGNTVAKHHRSTSQAIVLAEEDASSSAVVATAEASFDGTDVLLDWTTVDGTARQFLYFAFGDEAAPEPPPAGGPSAGTLLNRGLN